MAASSCATSSKLTASAIERVELGVQSAGAGADRQDAPQTGLEGKFSVYHATAAAIVEGAGGTSSSAIARCALPEIVALRGRVTATVDPAIKRTRSASRWCSRMVDGCEKFVEHAVGSVDRPLPDKDLEGKVEGLVDGILPRDRARRMMDLCWNMEKSTDAAALARATVT